MKKSTRTFITLALLANLLSSCVNRNRTTNPEFAKYSEPSGVLINQLTPMISSMSKAGDLPGVDLAENEILNAIAIPELCRVGNRDSIKRMFILVNQEGRRESHSYVFTKSQTSLTWELTAAWTKIVSGYREARDLDQRKRAAKTASSEHVNRPTNVDRSSLFLVRPDPLVSRMVKEKFFSHAETNRVPYSSYDQREIVAALPGPSTNKQGTNTDYIEIYVALKDKSAELFYLFTRPKISEDWVLAGVVKLQADGTATIPPLK
jgi:hypothetical protein